MAGGLEFHNPSRHRFGSVPLSLSTRMAFCLATARLASSRKGCCCGPLPYSWYFTPFFFSTSFRYCIVPCQRSRALTGSMRPTKNATVPPLEDQFHVLLVGSLARSGFANGPKWIGIIGHEGDLGLVRGLARRQGHDQTGHQEPHADAERFHRYAHEISRNNTHGRTP